MLSDHSGRGRRALIDYLVLLELGHGIHDLLSRTLYARHHAWRVPVEFGEALSTMLENWCWDKEMLQEISCHFATLNPEFAEKWRSQHPARDIPDERIPDHLLNPLIENRNLNRTTMILRQTQVLLDFLPT